MSNSPAKQPVLIITGMHRSGTSLTSALLQSAGLDIGQQLLQANYGNPKGYFENEDFLRFHERVLYASGLNPIGWTLEKSVTVPEDFLDEARALLERNASTVQPWGWKEPRTTLFLNFWNTLLPEAKFLFVYRAPWEVLDSLYRRRDDVFYQHPEFALKLWNSYNEVVLEFFIEHPEKSLLVNACDIASESCLLVEAIQSKLGIPLDLPETDIYEQELYHLDHSIYRPTLIKRFFPESFDLYCKLNAKADLACHAYIPDEASEQLVSSTAWVLKDWIDLRRAESNFQYERQELSGQIKQSQQEIQAVQAENQQLKLNLELNQEHLGSELSQAQAEIQQLKTQVEQDKSYLSRLKAQLAQSKGVVVYLKKQLIEAQDDAKTGQDWVKTLELKLQNAETEAKALRKKLADKHHRLKLRRADLQIKVGELQQARERIAAMETSKFWQVRKIWFNVKRLLGLPSQE